MKKRSLFKALALASVALPGVWLSTSTALAQQTSASKVPNASAPAVHIAKASCGAGDHTESGLQGETSMWERFSGDSIKGYNCNLNLVGMYRGDGAYSQDGPAYYGNCAYYATDNEDPKKQRHLGVAVIDASDVAHPKLTTYLDDTAAALAPHEAVFVSQARGLLLLAEYNGPDVAVYDVKTDCKHPVLKGEVQLKDSIGHMAALAPDGNTFWVTQQGPNRVHTYAVDISDPSNPKMLPPLTFPDVGQFHQVMINPPGFPAKGAEGGVWLYGGQASGGGAKPGQFVIVDVSDYQHRSKTPEAPIVSNLAMDPGTLEPQVPMMIGGHPYIMSMDEAGGASGFGDWATACEAGASSFGYPTIIDVSDQKNPKIVAKLWFEVNDPVNCERLRQTTPPDIPGTAPGTNLPATSGTTNYSTERCVPNAQLDAKIMACSLQNGNLRVLDIRDVHNVKEVAYWKPPAVRTEVRPNAGSWVPGVDRTVDKIAGWARWVKATGANGQPELQLWTVSDGNGFQVLRFSDNFRTVYKDLYTDVMAGTVETLD